MKNLSVWFLPVVVTLGLSAPASAGFLSLFQKPTPKASICNVDLSKITELRQNLEEVRARNKSQMEARVAEGAPHDYDIREILEERDAAKDLYKLTDSVEDYLKKGKIDEFHALTRHFPNPKEAALAMINAMNNAKYTIDMSYYIFANDDLGNMFLEAAKAALKRGVIIRVIKDGEGSLQPGHIHGELKALYDVEGGFVRDLNGNLVMGKDGFPMRATVETVIFNPLVHLTADARIFAANAQRMYLKFNKAIRLKIAEIYNSLPLPGEMNDECPECDAKIADVSGVADAAYHMFGSIMRRSHDKILGVDLQSASNARFFTGGRNLAIAYFGIPVVNSHTYNDYTVEVRPDPKHPEDHIGTHVAEYYEKLFNHIGNNFLTKSWIAARLGFYNSKLGNMDKAAKELLSPDNETGQLLAQMNATDNFNKMATETDSDGLDHAMVSLVNQMNNTSRIDAFLDPDNTANVANVESITAAITKMFFVNSKHSLGVVSPYGDFSDPEFIDALKKWLHENPDSVFVDVSDSALTADNMLDQVYQDVVVGPTLMALNDIPEFAGRVQYYQFGRLDAVQLAGRTTADGTVLDGKENYGKLHAKFYVGDKNRTITTTDNKDKISDFRNSEVGVVVRGQRAVRTSVAYHEQFVGRSYLFGSPEQKELQRLALTPKDGKDEATRLKRIEYEKIKKEIESKGKAGRDIRSAT